MFVLRCWLKTVMLAACVACGTVPAGGEETAPEQLVRPRCVRIEFSHSLAQGSGESFVIERVVDDGEWAGPLGIRRLGADLGLYLCEILPEGGGEPLFATGFCSVFGEWRTTAGAKDEPATKFIESIRVPHPGSPARVRISKRDDANRFAPLFEAVLPAVGSTAPPGAGDVVTIRDSGPLESCVDLLFLGDGYQAAEREEFLDDARRLSRSLLESPPYHALAHRINVRAAFKPSVDSGIANPKTGVTKQTALGCSYSTFGLARYVLTLDDRAWRDAAAVAPYDCVVILLNSREYGGGGIYNLYCVAAADSDAAEYLVAHEFGHSFAGLGDEYYLAAVAYENFSSKTVEPWEPNVTALLPGERLKWRSLVAEGTPLPTPWRKADYEMLSESTRSLRETLEREGLAPPLIASRVSDSRRSILSGVFSGSRKVGAYEGALYESTGFYRPEIDCIMFRRECTYYCRVCSAAVVGRIEETAGEPQNASIRSE
jgi:IgA Peptidase M64